MEMEFNLTRKDRDKTIEGLELFTYLGQPLDQSDYDWTVGRQNNRKARHI